MKIKSWMEVDGVENVSYRFQCVGICVGVRKKETDFLISEIDTSAVSKTVVIDFLKLFGFSVEFEEPPKLSRREYHYVNYMPKDAWLARDFKGLFSYDSKPYKTEISGEWEWEDDSDYECGAIYGEDLFPFITPDRAWSVKELRELEHE